MRYMTLEEFETKWGKIGKYHGGTWYTASSGYIVTNGFVTNHTECQYSGWDGYLTAIGIKPIDPRDAVFKSYGWEYLAGSSERWYNSVSCVVYRASGEVWRGLVSTGIYVKTAEQAEYLCKLLGLTKKD